MRLPTALVLVSFVLAGCGGADVASRPVPPAASGTPSVDWTARVVGDLLEVELADPAAHYRVDRVELVGPAGPTARVYELVRETTRVGVRPDGGRGVGVGIGGGYGSSGHGHAGIGLSFPLGGPPPAPAPLTRTVTRIALPDPAAYRRAPGRWSIRVTVSDAAGVSRVAHIPAPAPAPGFQQGAPSTVAPGPLHNK